MLIILKKMITMLIILKKMITMLIIFTVTFFLKKGGQMVKFYFGSIKVVTLSLGSSHTYTQHGTDKADCLSGLQF
jgi:hypothetical protein